MESKVKYNGNGTAEVENKLTFDDGKYTLEKKVVKLNKNGEFCEILSITNLTPEEDL